jgi:hypothetical protein
VVAYPGVMVAMYRYVRHPENVPEPVRWHRLGTSMVGLGRFELPTP